MPLKNWCSIHARWSKSSLKHSIRFCGIFSKFKTEFIAYHSFSHPDCIFEIYGLWQSGFSRVYSNCFCSCSFEFEIIKIGRSSHKIYSNSILNFQESTTILNAYTNVHVYIYILFADNFLKRACDTFTYFYLIRIILFTIDYLFACKYCYLSLRTQLSTSYLFAHSQMIKQCYFKQFRK